MDVDPAAVRGRGGIRIGDAERERAAETLGEHLRAGRLNVSEYDERLTAAFAARTAEDLTPLFTDLPGGSPLAPSMPAPPEPRWTPGGGRDRPRVQRRGFDAVGLPLRFVLALAVIAGVALCAAFLAFPPLWLIPLLWFGFGRRGHRRYGHCGQDSRRHHY